MDYQAAYSFIDSQGREYQSTPESFLSRLQQGKPPIPGQVTNILVALKMVFEDLRAAGVESIDRQVATSIYLVAFESRRAFILGQRAGVIWPPLLDEDIDRIGLAVKSILAGTWYENSKQ